jgi:hypothetical protein
VQKVKKAYLDFRSFCQFFMNGIRKNHSTLLFADFLTSTSFSYGISFQSSCHSMISAAVSITDSINPPRTANFHLKNFILMHLSIETSFHDRRVGKGSKSSTLEMLTITKNKEALVVNIIHCDRAEMPRAAQYRDLICSVLKLA